MKEFCEQCDRCADKCPAKAIPHGEPSWQPINISSIKGVKKWSVDGEKCFGYWSKINSDCAVCVRVCPYTRDYSKRRNRRERSAQVKRLVDRLTLSELSFASIARSV